MAWKHLGLNLHLHIFSPLNDFFIFIYSSTLVFLQQRQQSRSKHRTLPATDGLKRGHGYGWDGGNAHAVVLPWEPPSGVTFLFCFVFVFQLGDPRGLHHHTPSACCQGEAVYREHWGAGTGGQRAGQGNASVCLALFYSYNYLFFFFFS